MYIKRIQLKYVNKSPAQFNSIDYKLDIVQLSKIISILTCRETKQERGPICVNSPTLFTWVTMASNTSPLNGRNTIAWENKGEYCTRKLLSYLIFDRIEG